MPKPTRPDRFTRGGVYIVDLPVQRIVEITDGKRRERDGVEMYNSRPCVVISVGSFNDIQGRGLLVVPMTSAGEKFDVPQPTWIWATIKGIGGYILTEQVRYVDQSRCKAKIGELLSHELKWVENKLKQLLFES